MVEKVSLIYLILVLLIIFENFDNLRGPSVQLGNVVPRGYGTSLISLIWC